MKPITGSWLEFQHHNAAEGTYGPQEFRTDENGEIDLSMLPPGSYVVTE